MKIVKYAFVFFIFLVVGTLIATLFAPDHHSSENQIRIKSNKQDAWDFMSNPNNLNKWMMNLQRVDSIEKLDSGYSMSLIFEGEKERTVLVQQNWILDSALSRINMQSELPNKLTVLSNWEIKQGASDSIVIVNSVNLAVKGWLNKLLLSGATAGLKKRQEQEFTEIKKLVEN